LFFVLAFLDIAILKKPLLFS